MSRSDWDRLQYYSRKVKIFTAMFDDDHPGVHPLTYFRIAQLQSSALFPSLRHLRYDLGDPSVTHIFLFLSPLLESVELFNINGVEDTVVGSFLATLSSPMLSRIVLRNGEMSVDVLKRSIVHFKHLRSLELLDAVFMSDFALWEALGTLPSLANFTLRAVDPHPMPPETSSSQSGGPKYFDVLESLCITGSFFLIQRLLGFIDSPCLKSIKVYPDTNCVRNNHDHKHGLFASSMTIIASKWSRSLQNLIIGLSSSGITHPIAISKCLMPLTDLHEMQTFHLRLKYRWMENLDDDIRRLVKSWPKIIFLNLKQTLISLPTLRIIAENCPELRHLHIQLDTSTLPPFDSSSKTLHHNLEVLNVAGVFPLDTFALDKTTQECHIQVARHLDLFFPYLKSIELWDDTCHSSLEIRKLVKLCQDGRRVK